MFKLDLKTSALLVVIFFTAYFISYLYEGLVTLPSEGDSLAYHIPLARSVLSLKILRPEFYLGFYPANAEILLSLLLFLGVPLNTFNVIGWLVLFIVLYFLARGYGLSNWHSLLFSSSVCLSHTMLRWLNTQVIDIWLAVFYSFCLLKFHTFRGSRSDYFLLGLFAGLLTGVKYSGPLFLSGIILLYWRKIFKQPGVLNYFIFAIPFFSFGLTWYIRNLVVTGNPIYPQPLFDLPGYPGWNIFNMHVWEAVLVYPGKMLNALTAEFNLWPLLVSVMTIAVLGSLVSGKVLNRNLWITLILSVINILIFVFLPTTSNYDIIVSSFRYSYPAFITFMLSIFIYISTIKKESILIICSLCNIAFLPSLSYRPKLAYISLTLAAAVIYVNKFITKRSIG